jgi:hypothetical protein
MALLLTWSAFYLFSYPVLSSFLAVGPPAAPKLHSLGSANSFQESELNIPSRDLNSAVYPLSNSTFDNSASRYLNNSQYQDYVEDIQASNNYFWLADPKYEYRVCLKSKA